MIAVSRCLIGENCTYAGKNNLCKEIKDLYDQGLVLPLCPEVLGGLPIPRIPAEIVKRDKPFIVQNQNGEDVTINFLLGAKKALDLCKEENIKVALMKANSPSCGNIKTYDGTFTKNLIEASGLTAKLLKENGIEVFNENELKELLKFIKTNK